MAHRNNSANEALGGAKSLLNEDIKFSLTDVDSDDLMCIGLSDALMEDGYISSPADFEIMYSCMLYTRLRDNNDGTTYKVYTSEEDMDEDAHETMKSWVEDDPIEYMSFDTALSYFDRDVLADEMRSYATDYVYDLREDELIDELESYRIIDEDDKIPDPDWERDPDDPDEEPDMIYPQELLDDSRDELVDRMCNMYRDPADWFSEVYGEEELIDYVNSHAEHIDIDSYVDYMIRYDGVEDILSSNHHVVEFSYKDAEGVEVTAFAAED